MSLNPVQRWGGEPGLCPQCGLKVFAAEEVMANGHKWHRLCLKCSNCHKLLSQGALCNHEESIYCKPCHTKLFGPKGYGFAGGAAGLPTETFPGESVVPLRQSASVNYQSHTNGVSEPPELQKAKSATYTTSANHDAVCKVKPMFGAAPKCRRCNGNVYAAERVLGGGNAYHKSCFKCCACDRKLDSVILCERDEDLFCKSCYGKNFGPKGFGFGIASLNTEP